jgi:hypothetical protein
VRPSRKPCLHCWLGSSTSCLDFRRICSERVIRKLEIHLDGFGVYQDSRPIPEKSYSRQSSVKTSRLPITNPPKLPITPFLASDGHLWLLDLNKLDLWKIQNKLVFFVVLITFGDCVASIRPPCPIPRPYLRGFLRVSGAPRYRVVGPDAGAGDRRDAKRPGR